VAVNAMTWYSLMRKTYGDEFLRTIGKAATYVPSAVPGAQQLAAGAAAIYAPAVHQILVGLVAKGAPIGQAFIEPTLSTDNLVSVNARAPNPAVARLLLDFALSVPGQAILNADGFSPRTGVPGTRPLPTLSEADPQATRAETPQMLALLGLA
jgi:iron(III) transport system substrate-binding protein